MAEVLLILSYICSKQMLMCVPVLLIVGYLVKHYTTIPNAYIPYIECAIGLVIGVLYGGLIAKGFINIFSYGAQGLVLGFISISLYDAVHGVVKLNCCKENRMKEEKKKFKPFEHSSIVYACALVCSIIVFGLIKLVFYGGDSCVKWLLDEAHGFIYVCLLTDILMKLIQHKERGVKIVWQYWVLVGFIFLSDIAYVTASIMPTWTLVFVFIICGTVGCLLAAILWCNKMYIPAIKKRDEELLEIGTEKICDISMSDVVANGCPEVNAKDVIKCVLAHIKEN